MESWFFIYLRDLDQCASLHPDIIHSQEFDKMALGRNHYGQCLVINSKKRRGQVEKLFEEQSCDKPFVAFRLFEVIFLCCYLKPCQNTVWIESKLEQLANIFLWYEFISQGNWSILLLIM
jgi:hypothetical protein